MEKRWNDDAWAEYCWWQEHDRKRLAKINKLIRDIERDPKAKPSGKGELLGDGKRSVRIDQGNRLTYKIANGALYILGCRGHYSDK